MAEPIAHLFDMLANAERWQLEDEISNLAMDSRFVAGLEATATLSLPLLAFGMMLNAVWDSDQQALEEVRNENTQTGFSQGLIMGLLGWKWSQVDDRFVQHYVLQIYQRQDLNDARVLSDNIGLHWVITMLQTFPSNTKRISHSHSKDFGATAGAWTRRDQIDYVIDLAARFANHLHAFRV